MKKKLSNIESNMKPSSVMLLRFKNFSYNGQNVEQPFYKSTFSISTVDNGQIKKYAGLSKSFQIKKVGHRKVSLDIFVYHMRKTV